MRVGDERSRHALVSALFLAARDLAPGERDVFLERETHGDCGVRRQVSSLLDQAERNDDFLDTPAMGEGFHVPRPDQVPSAPLPEQVAGYRVLGRLGVGGMGVVYRACGGASSREVALKLLRPGMATPEAVLRFAREADLLARLDHPGIARIFAAGTSDEGAGPQPWLAMELVGGDDLLTHCKQRRLGRRARVALLAQVCDAIDHAHGRGVVHRDLKPANVVIDASGRPRVLDFGVARACDGDLERTSLLTRPGELLGTLPYMSPEQVGGDPAAVDGRSDVYALGAMLYELLCGARPHDLSDLPFPEAVRVAAEADPRSLAAIDPTLRGDLDTIAHAAMQRDPDRRYARAADLAADLRRHLNGEPIVARPASATEHLVRLARRHRALLVVAATALVALLGLASGLAWGWVHALDAQAVAEAEAVRAGKVSAYLADMMGRADPTRGGGEVTLREVLEAATEEIEERFAADPLVLGDMHHSLGVTFYSLGDLERAEDQCRKAFVVRSDHLGADDPGTLEADNDVGVMLLERGRLDDAVAHLERSWRHHVRALGEGDGLTMMCRGNLGRAYFRAGRYELAEEHCRANLAMKSEVLGDQNPATVVALVRLADVLSESGEFDQALALNEAAWSRCKEVLGRRHPKTVDQANNLAMLLRTTDPERRTRLLRENLHLRREVLGPDHPDTLQSTNNLGCDHIDHGRYAEAEELLREVHRRREVLLGPEHPSTLVSLNNLADCLRKLERWVEAERCFRDTVAVAAETLPEGHWHEALFRRNLGLLLGDRGRHAEGEPEMLAAHRILSAAFPADHARVCGHEKSLREFYLAWGRPEAAARWSTQD